MRSVVDYFSVQTKNLRLSVELKYISLHYFHIITNILSHYSIILTG